MRAQTKTTFYRLFSFLSILLSSNICWSQVEIADSLMKIYEQTQDREEKIRLLNDITYAHCLFDPKTGVEYGEEAIELSKDFAATEAAARAYLNTAIAYHLINEWDTVKVLANISLSKANTLEEESIQIRALNILGIVAVSSGQLDEALDHYHKGLEIGLGSPDSIWAKTTFYNNIGGIYGRKGDFKQALIYFEKNIILSESLNQPDELIMSLANTAHIASQVGMHDKVLAYLKRAEQLAIEYDDLDALMIVFSGLTPYYYTTVDSVDIALKYGNRYLEIAQRMNSSENEGTALINLVDIYRIKGDLNTADSLLTEAESVFRNDPNPTDQINLLYCSAILRFAQQRYAESLEYSNSMLELAQKEERLELIRDAEECRFKALEAMNNHQAALTAYKKFISVGDSIESTAFGEQIIALESELTNLENEKALVVLSQEKLALESGIQRARFSAISGVLLLALFLLIAVFLITRQRQQNLLLEQEKELALSREAVKTQKLLEKEIELEKNNNLLALRSRMVKELELKLEKDGSDRMTLEGLKNMKLLTVEDDLKLQVLFDDIFPNFLNRIKQELPKLSASQMRMIMLIKLGFDNTEMSKALAISMNSVYMSRYRLRKKLDLNQEEDFQEFIKRL